MDEHGHPLYGDVFGLEQPEGGGRRVREVEEVDKSLWGELESEEEEEEDEDEVRREGLGGEEMEGGDGGGRVRGGGGRVGGRGGRVGGREGRRGGREGEGEGGGKEMERGGRRWRGG